MTGRRRAASAVALAGLVVGLAVGSAGVAHAGHRGLLVSSSPDGPFREQLPGSLLDDLGRVVPLDTVSETFFVKNSSPQVARTTVAVVNRGEANALTDALTVTVDVGGTVSTGTLSPDTRSCELVTTGPKLRPGVVQPVEVSVEVGNLTGQRGMRERFALDVDVTLAHLGGSHEVAACGAQASAEPPAADCGRTAVVTLVGAPRCVPTAVDAGMRDGLRPPRDPGAVAGTGAALLVLGGAVLLAVQRRRRTASVDA